MKRKRPGDEEIAAGHWDVADPEPAIIQRLRQMRYILESPKQEPRRETIDKAQRLELRTLVNEVLLPWEASEDIGALQAMLGVSSRGRRRSQKTVNFEWDLAFAVAEHEARGTVSPIEIIAAEAEIDEKTVRRAVKKWPSVRKVVGALREEPSSFSQINYTIRKPDTK
jgi:hypothetical protein